MRRVSEWLNVSCMHALRHSDGHQFAASTTDMDDMREHAVQSRGSLYCVQSFLNKGRRCISLVRTF
jgi:hypothetical protein